MTASGGTEEIVDYSGFDFAGLWKGRDRVSEVERSIVARAFPRKDRLRLLEVGTGFGRLLGSLTAVGREVVTTDLDLGSLERLRLDDTAPPVVRVAANLYHLPFAEGSFTGATMVRVHHHLLDPSAALSEVARVLRGGSSLIISYQPTPSLGTLVLDVQRALTASRTEPFRSVTFARRPIVLTPHPFPIRAAPRREFGREAARAGFSCESEVGTGFEEYSPLRWIRAESFVRLGTNLGRAPAFPTRFVRAVKVGSAEGPLPPLSAIFACPRCRCPQPDWGEVARPECESCHFAGGRRGSVLDLRFSPPRARRWEVGG